jgi:hypothetical protein
MMAAEAGHPHKVHVVPCSNNPLDPGKSSASGKVQRVELQLVEFRIQEGKADDVGLEHPPDADRHRVEKIP